MTPYHALTCDPDCAIADCLCDCPCHPRKDDD